MNTPNIQQLEQQIQISRDARAKAMIPYYAAIDAAKASAIANAGQQGLSTDPTQNTALAQTLANIDQQGLVTQGNLEETLSSAGTAMIQTANQLISTGLSATQMSAQLQEYLINLDQTLSQQTGTAISNFAAALGGQQKLGTVSVQL